MRWLLTNCFSLRQSLQIPGCMPFRVHLNAFPNIVRLNQPSPQAKLAIKSIKAKVERQMSPERLSALVSNARQSSESLSGTCVLDLRIVRQGTGWVIRFVRPRRDKPGLFFA